MVSLQVDGCSKKQRHFIGIVIQYAKEEAITVRTLAVEEIFASSSAEYLRDMQSIRCAAHTLQLAVDDALKADRSLKSTIESVRRLANYLRTPTVAFQIKEARLPLPTLDVCTRWGSLYDMLTSVFNLRNFIEFTLVWTKKEDKIKLSLTEEEWDSAERIANDLAPARKATVKLQRQSLTLGDFFAIWTEMTLALQKKERDLAKSLLSAMEERAKAVQYSKKGKNKDERLSSLFDYDPAFCAVVFLDPRFFSLLDTVQIEEAKSYLMELWKRLQAVKGVPTPSVDVESDDEELRSSDSDQGQADFLKHLQARNRERKIIHPAKRETGIQDVAVALENYARSADFIPADAEVFKYWKKRRLTDPILHELALIVLAIPAT
ncbi:Zinc finger BED domain-containing protein 4, partial [Frankliniella fusca]